MKNKARRYSIPFIGLLFVLSSWIVACGQPAPSLLSPVPPLVQPPPAAGSPPSEQVPPVDQVANGEEWNIVETFAGEGNKTTPSFHISGIKWRITWTADAEYPEYAVFDLFVYPEGPHSMFTEKISHSGGSASDTVCIHEGGRDYHIKVIAANLGNWTITVDDYATKASESLSHVQITRIHYKGTVYLTDPKECVCFERVEPDEYVSIKNPSDCYQEMSGWVLKNITKGYPSFTFPSRFFLGPSEIIRVYTDEVHSQSGGFTFYYGPGDIWDNEEPDVAALYNAEGEEVSRKSYMVPAESQVSPDE